MEQALGNSKVPLQAVKGEMSWEEQIGIAMLNRLVGRSVLGKVSGGFGVEQRSDALARVHIGNLSWV